MLNRTPFITGVSDNIQNRTKTHLLSAYAVGKLFSGVTLPADFDLGTYTTPGVCRVSTYLDGPPVTSPGYLVVHTVNLDEEINGEKSQRVRQIYYPDDLTNTTPYSRVGVYNAGTNTYTWSVWTTLGGNWITDTLTENRVGIVGYMYHSFGPYTLTLPDPALYTLGTRIGLTQWMNTGRVQTHDISLQMETPADINTPVDSNFEPTDSPETVGALEYIFSIVPVSGSNTEKTWALEADNSYDSQVTALVNLIKNSDDGVRAGASTALSTHNSNKSAHPNGFNHNVRIENANVPALILRYTQSDDTTEYHLRATARGLYLAAKQNESFIGAEGQESFKILANPSDTTTKGRVQMYAPVLKSPVVTAGTFSNPALTGTPTAPTAVATATGTTQVANTLYVKTVLSNHNVSDSAHQNEFNKKANLASPTFTGTPKAPTASAGTSTTQIATTAFVTAADVAHSTSSTAHQDLFNKKANQTELAYKDRRMLRHIVIESATTLFIRNYSTPPSVPNGDDFTLSGDVPEASKRGLSKFSYTLYCRLNGKTFDLPSFNMSAGYKVIFIIAPGVSITVQSGNVSEIFTAPNDAQLVVDMESINDTTWTVLTVG